MARRRKQTSDSRQLSLFDIMVSHIEQIREENIQDDIREEAGTRILREPTHEQSPSATPPVSPASHEELPKEPEHPGKRKPLLPPDDSIPPKRLGVNGRGFSVYETSDGGRMYSPSLDIVRFIDGDRDTPEELFRKGNEDYLTVQEVAAFRQQHSSTQEVSHAGQTDKSAGHRQNRSQARNHSRPQGQRVHQFSLLDSRPLGTEQSRRTEAPGRGRESGLADTTGSAAGHREEDAVQRIRPAGEPAGDVGLGDFGKLRGGDEPENYRISPEDQLGVGGAKKKYADNLAAIRLLKQLQANGAKLATPEEKSTLVRFVGWGGLPQVFDPKNDKWAAEYRELQGVLSPDEYAAARRSTQDAHYTSETVIRGIYQGLSRLGVETGKELHILEPSAGIGNFIGLCPESFQARFLAVELEPTTAAIAAYLYPKARHINNGFQNIPLNTPSFDLAVGNPPFGNQSLYDPEFPELKKFSIHNYFLAKSMRLLREGGIAAFVVSRYFMDAVDSSAREHIAGYADFLGAVRLPETAFRQNALTDVTTDIVFFQKHNGENKRSLEWLHTSSMEVDDLKHGGRRTAVVNSYFASRPEQIIGRMAYSGGMFEDSLNCVSDASQTNLGEEIARRLDALPAVQFSPLPSAEVREAESGLNHDFLTSDYFQSLKMGALCVEPQSRKIVFKTSGEFGDGGYEPVTVKNETARLRLSSMIQLRDTLRELLNEEKGEGSESRMANLRQRLNTQYDAFVKKYGHLNSQTNRSLMREDPEHALLESLEADYDKGISPDVARKTGRQARPASARKAAVFRQRVLKPATLAQQAKSPKDALVIALRESGKVDFARMEQLLGRSTDVIQRDLQEQGLIFLNPATELWEIRDKYLTGNVRAKLRQARDAASSDTRFLPNVEALTEALPPDIEAVDIGVKFGSAWLPPSVISDFIEHLHGGKGSQQVDYLPTLGRWSVRVYLYDVALNTTVWGIPEYPAEKIIEALLMNKPIKVEKETGQRDEQGRPITVLDQELTAAAMQKADEIKQAFTDWIWTDDDRRASLSRLYNDRFNTNVPPRYDGSHLELVGASSEVKLRPHQKDAVWRAIQEGTALFDHVVGAGKTMACIATIMESKRMGFVSKPMVVVPNHLLHQWRDEFYKLYPNAHILVADKTDFTKQNRERLFSRIATGDWDAVIVAHSSFRKIDMPHDIQREILKEQIDAVLEAIEAVKEAEGGRATVKQLEKQRENMEARYELLLAGTGKKDTSVDFADLGVDALFVDESHEFKNLAYQTTMNVSGLGNITGSAKALDLFIKCRYLQRKNEGRGVYFLTGTPISNTIAEVYTLQRYMQYEELQAKGIDHFDSWASTFGQVTSGWELDATGVNYKLKSRFAKFQNIPELLAMYRTFADVVTKNDLDEQAKQAGLRPLTPPVTDGKPYNDVAERSGEQAAYMEKIIHRMENLPPDPRQDNPLKITNDARKAGLDYRLIEPHADDFAGSKVNAAVERIYHIWSDTAADRGTQLVFCDLSTPKGGRTPTSAPANRNDLELETLLDVDGTLLPEQKDEESHGTTQAEKDDSGEDTSVASDMDAVIALSSKFSVYDDIRSKLVARGVPPEEIAFIHEANTDIRKAKLFSDMNAGHVRILLGSTSKMGAGMNVQKRLVAAHHLDAPWRPSDLEQRNGRIIRQGNLFYERDPEHFSVGIYNYATKQTYDARMWQTIEYKAAAIEQFRKGDLLQRVIDDVQSEAANAAEMKAAASGNPLILMQVQLAADLRKLEVLYSQHQRGQHRLRDRLKWLNGTDERLAKAESAYAANIRHRDSHTHIIKEKDKEKIRIELFAGDKMLTDRDGEKIKDILLGCVKEITRNAGARVLFGSYRGFAMHLERYAQSFGGKEGFRIVVTGTDGQEFKPDNLVYLFDDKLSLSGLFQRMDNFLAKGFEEAMEKFRETCRHEKAELETTREALGREFPQKEELTLARENHSAIIRELQRMQDDASYVSHWTPKTSDAGADTTPAEETRQETPDAPFSMADAAPKDHRVCTLTFGEQGDQTEYAVTHSPVGYLLNRSHVRETTRWPIHCLYDDNLWHSLVKGPPGVRFKQFESREDALNFARQDAALLGFADAMTHPEKDLSAASATEGDSYRQAMEKAGFRPSGMDFYGKQEHELKVETGDGGIFELRIFQTEEGKVGLRVQYEKDHIINGARTVHASFDTLKETLDYASIYKNMAETQNITAPPVQETFSMRMR